MKKLLLALAVGGLMSSAAMADEQIELAETVPHKDKDRQSVIEMIRVTSKKEVIESEVSDAAVQSILEELDAIEEEVVESDDAEASS